MSSHHFSISANHDDVGDCSKSESIRIEASKLCCIFAFVHETLHYVKDRSLKDSVLDFLDDVCIFNFVLCILSTLFIIEYLIFKISLCLLLFRYI